MAREVVLGMKLIHLDRKAFQHRHGFDLVRLCAPAVDYSGRKLAAAVDAIAS